MVNELLRNSFPNYLQAFLALGSGGIPNIGRAHIVSENALAEEKEEIFLPIHIASEMAASGPSTKTVFLCFLFFQFYRNCCKT